MFRRIARFVQVFNLFEVVAHKCFAAAVTAHRSFAALSIYASTYNFVASFYSTRNEEMCGPILPELIVGKERRHVL